MRLFVAIELPERLRTAVVDLGSRLRSTLPKARWVKGANLHLTLVFLGEIDEPKLPRLASGLQSALAGRAPFQMQLQGSGCFPERGRARVAWLGFETCPEVVSLQGAIARALRASVGYEPERRPYRPHLTVARCSPPWPTVAARRWSQALEGELDEPFRVDSIALVRSRLSSAGAIYSNVHRFGLEGAA